MCRACALINTPFQPLVFTQATVCRSAPVPGGHPRIAQQPARDSSEFSVGTGRAVEASPEGTAEIRPSLSRFASPSPQVASRSSACHYPHLQPDRINQTSGRTAEPRQSRRGPDPDANGVAHTSPGQRPGLTGPKIMASAESAILREMKQADGLQTNPIAREPRALPWAGMSQAVGLNAAASMIRPQPGRWKMWVMTSAQVGC